MTGVTTDPALRPPPGWYPDPQDGSQQRWWDGTAWTARQRGIPPPRSTKGIFAAGAAWGALAGIALVGFAQTMTSGSAAYVAGESLGTGLLAGLGAAVIANAVRFRWRWWFYPPLVTALWSGLFIVGHLDDLASRTSPDAPRMSLSAPATVGDLARRTGPEVEAAQAQAEDDLGGDVASLVMAVYAAEGKGPTLVFTGANLAPGRALDRESIKSPATVVRDALAGAGIDDREYVDAGTLGGSMMCGPTLVNKIDVYVCFWSTTGVLGNLTIEEETDRAAAAARTREFRRLAEHPANP